MQAIETNTDAGARTNGFHRAGQWLAAAAVMARKGRYDEAIKLVQNARATEACSPAESLDLLACIYAQQGRYFDAECCWREAKELDETNPAYDDALARLRRSRLVSGRFVQIMVMVLALASCSLLLWQTLIATPGLFRRQDATNESMFAIRGDVAALQEASQERGQELALSVAATNRSLVDLKSHWAKQLKPFATSAEVEKQLSLVVSNLEEMIAGLQVDLEQTIGGQTKHYEKLVTDQTKEALAVKASVADVRTALADVEGGLEKCTKEVERMESSIRSDVKQLPTFDDMAEFREVVECEIDSLGMRSEEFNKTQQRGIVAAEMAVADLRRTLTAVDSKLDGRIREVQRVETAIRNDILSTAADLNAIGRSVLVLQRQLNEIHAVINLGKGTTAQNGADVRNDNSDDEPTLPPEELQ